MNRDGKEKNLLRRYELDELGSSASLHFLAQLKSIRVGRDMHFLEKKQLKLPHNGPLLN